MWSYYGAKTNTVNSYPKPIHGKIIEPFAGSARYSLKYFDREIILVEKYQVVADLWKWLQKCSPADINKLPHFFKPNQALTEFTYECKEASDLVGFLLGFGMERPRVTASSQRMVQRPNHINYSLNRIAKNLFKIKDWKIIHGSYEEIPQQEATWFIDPPYQFGGECYPESSKKIDFEKLGIWSRDREGQIIVCENTKATWLPFIPLTDHHTSKGYQREAIWSNLPTAYHNLQTKLF